MVEYKLFYKMPGIDKWKYFFFDADNDLGATLYAGDWAAKNKPTRYGVEKITTTRLV
ncbi:hypothetical protein P59_110 [Bacillus phage P59]|nr:hypothetical protein P59_110 [Bacillus phage P59]